MNILKDIETAIGELTPQECEELREWFDRYHRPQPVDGRLMADLDAARLDDRMQRTLAERKAGRTQPR